MPVNEFDANDPYDWADEYLDWSSNGPEQIGRFISYAEWRDYAKGA